MKFKVRLVALADRNTPADKIEIREMNVPEEQWKLGKTDETYLDMIFHYGQNEIQPIEKKYSISVGDVIEFKDSLFVVLSSGFKQIDESLYKRLLEHSPIQRSMAVMSMY